MLQACSISSRTPSKELQSTSQVVEEAVLPEESMCVVSSLEESRDEDLVIEILQRAKSQGDVDAVKGLLARGKVVELSRGTHVRLSMFPAPGSVRERIAVLSGYYAGLQCTLEQNVVHASPP
jgi:hypothetical protein